MDREAVCDDLVALNWEAFYLEEGLYGKVTIRNDLLLRAVYAHALLRQVSMHKSPTP